MTFQIVFTFYLLANKPICNCCVILSSYVVGITAFWYLLGEIGRDKIMYESVFVCCLLSEFGKDEVAMWTNCQRSSWRTDGC